MLNATAETHTTDSNPFEEYDNVYIPTALRVFIGIGIFVLIILAVVGNLLVILSFIKDKQLQTVYNMYVTSLAVCDFFIGSISMPFYAYFTLSDWEWVFGDTFCVVWSVNDYSFCLEMIFLTILISLDRALLVTNGARYITKEKKCVTGVKIAISFVLSFGTYGTCIVGWKYWRGYSILRDMDCDVEFSDSFYFNLAIAMFELTLPVGALSVLNFIVFWQIRKRMKQHDHSKIRREEILHTLNVQALTEGASYRFPADDISRNDAPATRHDVTTTQYDAPTTRYDVSTTQRDATTARNDASTTTHLYDVQRSARRDTKAAKSLAVLVIAFLVMWGPYTVTQVVQNVCDDCVNSYLNEFFVWLLWAKSAVNPFLYALQNDRFKANIFSFLRCKRFFIKTNNRVANHDRT
ncbi:histamine H3 receptor-like [Gigantopelta aegis]|uniref:histamine H3 receptor-like n=1 Tax=Gigantopelta aegis TaxID=1735272 RepID=UPI001B88A2F1|nr:histamine H3 receptor-like [Gigantopelta aegis]